MSGMMEKSGKHCQCECWKGKLRRQMHRKTEKDTHREKTQIQIYLSWRDLRAEGQNIWTLIRYSSLKSDAFVMSCLTHWSRWTGCPAFFFLFPVSCLACRSLWAAAACWVVRAQQRWPHNHIVSCSPPKETPKTPHHTWGLLPEIFGQGESPGRQDGWRSTGSRRLWMIRQRETFRVDRSWIFFVQTLEGSDQAECLCFKT